MGWQSVKLRVGNFLTQEESVFTAAGEQVDRTLARPHSLSSFTWINIPVPQGPYSGGAGATVKAMCCEKINNDCDVIPCVLNY